MIGAAVAGTRHAADAREARVFADLEAPALVVREVPVQDVELVPGHPVEHRLHELRGLEVTRGVEHQAAPRIRGGVVDDLRAQLAGAAAGRQELPERDRTIKEAGAGGGGDSYTAGCGFEVVALRCQARLPIEGDGGGAAWGAVIGATVSLYR